MLSVLLLAGCNDAGGGSVPSPASSSVAPAGYSFPKFTDWVVDDAGLLSGDQIASLHAKCRTLQMTTGRQLAVVTLRSLQGHDVADYSLKLANFWGVGRKGLDDGVLLMIAPTAHALRIEVGRGLETVLTNEEAAAIIERNMMPALRAGNVPSAIANGVDRILRELSSAQRKAA